MVTRAVSKSVTTTRDTVLRIRCGSSSLSHCHRHCRRRHTSIDNTHTLDILAQYGGGGDHILLTHPRSSSASSTVIGHVMHVAASTSLDHRRCYPQPTLATVTPLRSPSCPRSPRSAAYLRPRLLGPARGLGRASQTSPQRPQVELANLLMKKKESFVSLSNNF